MQAEIEIVSPADTITDDPQFMKGHGTFGNSSGVVSSLAGQVLRVNKLISVVPLNSRYAAEVGDVVIGRIIDVGFKKWKVDLKAKQDAVLLLSSVNLPGGAQRRRVESDELEMRQLFSDGDLVVAEVQQHFHDGAVSLHTRSLKYGKLNNGTLITIPSSLVKRQKAHFIRFDIGEMKFDIIMGVNGLVFVRPHQPEFTIDQVEADAQLLYSNSPLQPISIPERQIVAKLCNLIKLLASQGLEMTEDALKLALNCSADFHAADLLQSETADQILKRVAENS